MSYSSTEFKAALHTMNKWLEYFNPAYTANLNLADFRSVADGLLSDYGRKTLLGTLPGLPSSEAYEAANLVAAAYDEVIHL